MKSNGVIKRMDELGRIVIPKEMRRMLNITDNEVLELFVSDNNLIMKKHSSFEGIISKVKKIIDIFDEFLICKAIVVDKEKVITSNLDVIGLPISEICKKYVLNREEAIDDGNSLKFGDIIVGKHLFFCPLITDLDSVGGVILIFDSDIDEHKKKIGKLLAKLIVSVISNFS